jgi:hypothetical protein
MSKLPGVLGDYVTVAMAVELLGFRKEQTGRFYALVNRGLPTYKVGGMTLAKFAELAELASLPAGSKPSWPSKLGELEMKHLHSRGDAADILNVSPRTVNRQAASGIVGSVDLSPWGGYTLYQIGEIKPLPTYISMGRWKMVMETDEKGRLHIVATGGDTGHPFIMLGMSSHPQKAFIHSSELEPAVATFRVAGVDSVNE